MHIRDYYRVIAMKYTDCIEETGANNMAMDVRVYLLVLELELLGFP
jgi:hypothetical protein